MPPVNPLTDEVAVLIRRLDPGLPLPARAHPGDAGADLVTAVDVELAILEPDALARARSLSGAPVALNNFMQTNALTMMEVFRQRISIPVVPR